MSIYENGFSFQADWFSPNIPVWEKMLAEFKDKPYLRFLEIGTFEGQSAIWAINNILTHPSSKIVCIDTFEGSDEHPGMGIDISAIEATFRHNIQMAKGENRIKIKKGYSQAVLRTLPFTSFDFAYIDGSHLAADVLTDAVLTFPLLKKGGILAFDDYHWDMDPNPLRRPQIAIKAFLKVFKGQYKTLHHDEQVFLRKCV